MEAEYSDDSTSEVSSSSDTYSSSSDPVSALLVFDRIVFEPFLP